MAAHALRLAGLLIAAVAMMGCPDSKPPRIPTTPKVPEPKIDVAPRDQALQFPAFSLPKEYL